MCRTDIWFLLVPLSSSLSITDEDAHRSWTDDGPLDSEANSTTMIHCSYYLDVYFTIDHIIYNSNEQNKSIKLSLFSKSEVWACAWAISSELVLTAISFLLGALDHKLETAIKRFPLA